jgi:hypothetical protein
MTNTALTSGSQSNCSLAYNVNGTASYFTTRCTRYGHGYDVIATESHARQYRAFYPRQRAFSPFYLTLSLKGYSDFKALMDFIRAYMKSFMVAANNAMYINVTGNPQDPNNNDFFFANIGVPIGGVTDEDHVGSMIFAPTIVFQSLYDPLDTTLFSTTSDASTFNANQSQADEAATFFYPVLANTNDPNSTGESLYDAPPIVSLPTPGAPNEPIRGPH